MVLNLKEGERLIYEGKASWWNFWLLIYLGIITIFWGVGIIFFVLAYRGRINSKYIITNKRVYSKYGIIRRIVRDAPHEKIHDTAIIQGVIGRMVNIGDLRFNTAGGYASEIIFKGVSDPLRVNAHARDLTK
ncbi:MAG: PH domain-containing protein [Candidatus Hydrothermarchaeota archaeon]|jgi:uncharacterized membrane protein YdbT with pleckstrin-like domain|nr:PH domain-containing protein [Candidatus Hydrothermarchaeota archaeon]